MEVLNWCIHSFRAMVMAITVQASLATHHRTPQARGTQSQAEPCCRSSDDGDGNYGAGFACDHDRIEGRRVIKSPSVGLWTSLRQERREQRLERRERHDTAKQATPKNHEVSIAARKGQVYYRKQYERERASAVTSGGAFTPMLFPIEHRKFVGVVHTFGRRFPPGTKGGNGLRDSQRPPPKTTRFGLPCERVKRESWFVRSTRGTRTNATMRREGRGGPPGVGRSGGRGSGSPSSAHARRSGAWHVPLALGSPRELFAPRTPRNDPNSSYKNTRARRIF
uniref:Putative secreted protein n=1 Tax=Ixodes ricinus TaxID=34613 RepID=A0A6B0V5K5_IXORI